MTTLSSCAHNEYSQSGEDGILRELFRLLGVDQGWCVELGAWDGVHLSNTHSLIKNREWRAVLIEADVSKFAELERNTRTFPGVICINRFIGFDPPDDLDSVLSSQGVSRELDLLSIDVDGNDYHIWERLHDCRPKVVVIEFNPTIPNDVEFVQPRDRGLNQGNSLLSLTNLGLEKGYELAAATTTNGIFVRDDLFPSLGIEDNSLDSLRASRQFQTTLFQLYDGTLVLHGFDYLLWHDMPIPPGRIQVLPRLLRTFPGSASPQTLALQRAWRGVERARRVLHRRMTTGRHRQCRSPSIEAR